MTSLYRKHWPIRLRKSEIERVKQAAKLEEERPGTWAREVLLREADRVLESATETDRDAAA